MNGRGRKPGEGNCLFLCHRKLRPMTQKTLRGMRKGTFFLIEKSFTCNIPHGGMRNGWIVSDMRVWKNDRTHSFWKQQTVVYALHGRQKIGHDNRAARHACVNSSITGKVELHGRYNPNGNQIPDGRDNSNG